jgi:hypothetical protein
MSQSTGSVQMPDGKWYPNGVPLVYLSMHNTKETVETDQLLKKMMYGARFQHGFCCVRVSSIGCDYCTVRVFRQDFALEDAIGSHACSLEALPCV